MIKPTVVILEGNYLGLEIARELKVAGYPFSIVGHSPGDMALQSKKVNGLLFT